MKVYYQFTLRAEGWLPHTMNKKFRSYERAIKQLEKYVRDGISGCMVTHTKQGKHGYSLTNVMEF